MVANELGTETDLRPGEAAFVLVDRWEADLIADAELQIDWRGRMSADRFEEEANSILHAVLYRDRRGRSDTAGPIQDGLEEAYRNGKESSTPSPAVKRLVEAVEAFMEVNEKALECDCDSCQEIFVPMRKALAAVREEMGEEAPTVICTNCADSFPEEELPDADMKGQVVCRKCIEKMALGD